MTQTVLTEQDAARMKMLAQYERERFREAYGCIEVDSRLDAGQPFVATLAGEYTRRAEFRVWTPVPPSSIRREHVDSGTGSGGLLLFTAEGAPDLVKRVQTHVTHGWHETELRDGVKIYTRGLIAPALYRVLDEKVRD